MDPQVAASILVIHLIGAMASVATPASLMILSLFSVVFTMFGGRLIRYSKVVFWVTRKYEIVF
jgi:hypothetical protein